MDQKLLYFALSFLITAKIVYGLECWHCSYLTLSGQNCSDPFKNNTAKMTCTTGEVCVKHATIKITYGDLQAPSMVMRTCSPAGYCSNYIEENEAEHCSICDTDLCNSAKQLLPTFAIVAAFTINYLL